MSIRTLRSVATVSALAAAILAPATVFAAGPYHPAPTEAGVTYHPEHASTRSRDQVVAEFDQATKHPSWNTAMSRGAPWPVTRSAEPKTRDQVNAELQVAMKNPAWSSVSRGAPWPPILANAK
ncbi:MAG: DUF4148 domain-containing protein [Gammaproteobacteria bacterium]|nr:DUF4148 domain-containing protein [Gammaproteobacteria bacterium]MBU1443294.1 DUF4148 domain-containing protein [Gammaproteobacteria bacterium]MBU2285087.1 DUF4148 domain-containing protein [Gammaproteobacteria bacterium]MBU2410938.1 DUF4148 domain-containing protein [Gammaproteobacteria bacterium]